MTTTTAELTLWRVDPLDTTVGFSIRHFMVTNVRGIFEKVEGTVQYDPRRPGDTVVRVVVGVASVNTHEPRRDAHLRQADMLDADRFPMMAFRSTEVAVRKDGLTLTGDLALHGVTRPVILDVRDISDEQEDHNGVGRMGAVVRGTIKRSEFGITYNLVLGGGRLAIADEVALQIDLSLMKTTAT